jgi:hypothetical protein
VAILPSVFVALFGTSGFRLPVPAPLNAPS